MSEDEKVIEHLRSCDKNPERTSMYTFENAIECIEQLRKERDEAQVDQLLIEELWQRRTDATEMGARIRQLLGNTEQLRAERDEARRELCNRCYGRLNAREEANLRGWDCYKETP